MPVPHFSFGNYFSIAYQDSFNNYIDHNYTHRQWYVDLINELNFHLFRYTPRSAIVIGKNDYLFLESSVLNYTGETYHGSGVIRNDVRLMKKVQDSLKKHNVDLIVVYAPGKSTFYSEFLPDRYIASKKDTNNYIQYCRELYAQGINFIDLNAYFLKLKNTSKYPLYPKYGAHWSYYGVAVGTDTIVKYIENKRQIRMPYFGYADVALNKELRYPDYDLEESLSLLFKLPGEAMPYPKFTYTGSNTYKPSVLVIGDSYWQNLIWAGIPKNLFKQDIFWRYFQVEFIDDKQQKVPIPHSSLKEDLLKYQVIILESSESNYEDFFFHFFEKTNIAFHPSADPAIDAQQQLIIAQNDWLDMVRKKAVSNGISLDSMIYLDAKYVLDQKK